MAWQPDTTNKFSRNRITLDDVKAEQARHTYESLDCFVEFLEKLDWSKTAIYYEEEGNNNRSRTGWRVIHATEEIVEKEYGAWLNLYAQTWFGLSSMMS